MTLAGRAGFYFAETVAKREKLCYNDANEPGQKRMEKEKRMLYKKNSAAELGDELFKNPTAEYRGTPFWAWNDNLDKDELLRQIECLKKMGFGGFHMHTRSGMATPYLSDEYMDLIRACVDKAKEENMLAWLYDEDRWPSGAAGGIVTKNKNFRQKYLAMTTERKESVIAGRFFSNYIGLAAGETPAETVDESVGYKNGQEYLLAVYDIVLNENGSLKNYRRIGPDDEAAGQKWYAYVNVEHDSGWYNGQAYLDTMMCEAVEEFVRVTHETYRKKVGDEFDRVVPAIFSDEPQFRSIDRAGFSNDTTRARITGWTTDLPITFRAAYGYDLVERLPEIFWDLDGVPSKARYHFHDHVSERFSEAFFGTVGKWCEEHHISMTGHLMSEPTLRSQSERVGETMRNYPNMQLPGIDMLCDEQELTTAKQTQSAVHQCGKEGMTSELYGVTGWDFDFRGHKFQGDWQAALGVTVRVPHLAWYSMKGSAKRDYPASINYQSAWYEEYPFIENHFARLNTALTRGTPAVRVAMIHPVESYWLYYGPNDRNETICQQMERNFVDINRWLLAGMIDFDYLCEATLEKQYGGSEAGGFKVGQMRYDAVIVPALTTIRSSTLKCLEDFAAAGGKIVWLGGKIPYVDAEISDRADALYEKAVKVPLGQVDLLGALESERDVRMVATNGVESRDYLYQKRQDGKYEWIFIARINKKPDRSAHLIPSVEPDDYYVTLRGHKKIKVYDTMTGEIYEVPYRFSGENTVFLRRLYASDSLLIRTEDASNEQPGEAIRADKAPSALIHLTDPVPYTRSEANVAVLDLCEWSEDGVHYEPLEEMLKIDQLLRRKYGFPDASGSDVQPWLLTGETIEHYPYLRFRFESRAELSVHLAFEELSECWLNGEKQVIQKDGYFTDKRIFTTALTPLRVGTNELILRMPFGKRLSLENCFLLGDFDVAVAGTRITLSAPSKTIGFGSVVHQGLPFYGAGLTYHIPFDTAAEADVSVVASLFKGALIAAKLDGEDVGKIAFAPYEVWARDVKPGHHILDLTLYISRVNCFNGLHNCAFGTWVGPTYWFTNGANWSYEYQLKDNGILKSPIIRIFNR